MSRYDEKGKLALNLLKQKRLVEAEIATRQVIEESIRLSGIESVYVVNYLQVLAEIFLAQGRLKHAEEIIKVALQLHENLGITSESQYYCLSKNTLVKILIAAGDYSGAADQFELFREKEHSNRYLYEIYYSQNIDVMLALAVTAKSQEIMPLIENAYRKSQKVFGENYLQTAELLAIRGIATAKLGELDLAYADFPQRFRLSQNKRRIPKASLTITDSKSSWKAILNYWRELKGRPSKSNWVSMHRSRHFKLRMF